MPFIVYVLIGLALAGLLAIVFWRGFFRHSPLPCPPWLGWLVERDNPLFKVNSSRQILPHLRLQTGMKVLDLGCGPGRLTLPIARQVGPTGRVTAFDLQEEMLRRVRAKAGREKLDNIEFVQGAVGEEKLGKEEYDRVLLVTVLGEIPDQPAALQEIFACLKPGGLLSITEVILDPHFQALGKVRKVARAAGFQEAEFFGSRISYTINFEKSP